MRRYPVYDVDGDEDGDEDGDVGKGVNDSFERHVAWCS